MSKTKDSVDSIVKYLKNIILIVIALIILVVVLHKIRAYQNGKARPEPSIALSTEKLPYNQEIIHVFKGVWSKAIYPWNENDHVDWRVLEDDVWLVSEINGKRYKQCPTMFGDDWRQIIADGAINRLRFTIADDEVSGRNKASVLVTYLNR